MRTLVFIAAGILAFGGIAKADRPAIENALGEMQHAAAAADVEGYLSHVSSADPIFYKEQFNWAKDLKRKPTESLRLSIGKKREEKDSVEEFGDKRARFEMVTTWTMPPEKEGVEAKERAVSFPVVFEADADGKWLYAGEDWLTMESEEPPARDARFQGVEPESARAADQPAHPPHHRQRGARVKYFPGYDAVAQRIVEVLPLVRDHVDEGFQNEVPRVQEVKIYPTMKHLQESIYLSYVDGLSGWNEPGESIKILTRPTTSKRSLRSLLAHEYGHVATFELGPKANDMPWWVLEGVAELSAERFVGSGTGREAEQTVLRWAARDRLAKWEDLADFHTVPGALQPNVYTQGQHMLMYISDHYGPEGRNAWMREMSAGKSIDEATKGALHLAGGFAELDAKWRDSVNALAAKAATEKGGKKELKDEGAKGKEPVKGGT